MNRKSLSMCFVVAGLVSVPALSVPAGGGTAGTTVSSAGSSEWDRDFAAPSGARPSWKAEGNQTSALFGEAVATAGDVNGDGYDDVIVGAWPYDTAPGANNEGRAFVYHGSASGLGLATTPDWTVQGDEGYSWFGDSVATAGDVNGDGYDDVIVGAPKYNSPLDEGWAFVYHGSASGLSGTPDWTAKGNQGSADFAESVGTAGDVNGDGYDDVIVGAPHYDNGEFDEGRAFVYHGSASGLSTSADWTAEINQVNAELGVSVGTAGDVNGDGYDDVIVGAHDNGQTGEGRAFVYHGSASGLSTTPDWTAESDQVDTWFGSSVGTAGDVNSDGYDDVIVGAHDDGQSDEGRVFVYHGSASGLSTTADWTAESDQVHTEFGSSVGTAGDVNGDGYGDVVVGAAEYDNGQTDEGGIVVYFGSASGLASAPYWTAESDQNPAQFGWSVGTAGDVNGDGYDDVIGGAPWYTHGQAYEGMAVVFHGRATPATP